MKKAVKTMSILLITIMLIASFSSIALAADDTVTSVLDQINQGGEIKQTESLTSLGGKIVAVVQVVGIVIAVIVILVIGIKYLVSSPEGKAEYKKTMIPYLVGAVLIFAGTTIVNVVYQVITNLK